MMARPLLISKMFRVKISESLSIASKRYHTGVTPTLQSINDGVQVVMIEEASTLVQSVLALFCIMQYEIYTYLHV
jgi:hypothetical protein